MRRIDAAKAVVSGALMVSAVSVSAITGPRRASSARHTESKIYHATGAIQSFGPGRAYVNIAHEAIPGYMGAMTMSFWPERGEQLDGLAVGDRIEFEFTETEDARRLLASIRKRP